MRTIKFRGKRLDNQKWVEGFYFTNGAQHGIIYAGSFSGAWTEIDPTTVGQFTGREDALINGVEVYGDDIIENCDTKELQIVYWNDDEAAWYCRYINDKNRVVSLADSLGNLNKVIGNVTDNPELLNQ